MEPTDSRSAARRAADQILQVSFASSEIAATARAERLLRDHALQFVAVDRDAARLAARQCLDELRRASGADHAMLVAMGLPGPLSATATAHVLASNGNGLGRSLFERIDNDFATAVMATLRPGRRFELPGDARHRVDGPLAPFLDSAGIASLAWCLRPIDQASVFVVALHAAAPGRYWTPASLRLLDGFADIFAAANPLLPADGPSGRQ